MSILGKLLIVFNLLAAGAFAYFTVGDWKARQDITWNALSRQVQLEGVAVEPPTPAPTADELEGNRVPFAFTMPGGVAYRTIPKARLDSLIPNGGEIYGGEAVYDQTAEVKRLQAKIAKILPAQGQPRFDKLKTYLLNIARTGQERDGINALFDLRDLNRASAARRDLPLMARTVSQTAALRTMVEIADLHDPQAIMPETARTSRIALARDTVKQFLLGEVAHGAEGDEPRRKLTNAVDAALHDRTGDAEKKALEEAATADPAGWKQLGNVAVEPLNDKPSCDRAIAGLLAFTQSHGIVESEKNAYAGIKDLVSPPPLGFNLEKSIESVAFNLLNSKFDAAQLPAGAGKSGSAEAVGEKARRIAHLLYHIDADRHAATDEKVKTDRKAWHTRVATIVGLPQYIRAAEAQASEYSEASQRLLAAITEEQSAFEAEYQAQVQRALFLFSQWQVLDNQLKAQDAITKENERLRDERQTEKTKLEQDLAQAKEDAKAALAKLKKTQGQLFAIQKDLRDAQAAILDLEKELRRLELGEK